jgi:hypothetical protein
LKGVAELSRLGRSTGESPRGNKDLLQVCRQEQELIEVIDCTGPPGKGPVQSQQLSVQGQIADSKTQADASGCTLRETC